MSAESLIQQELDRQPPAPATVAIFDSLGAELAAMTPHTGIIQQEFQLPSGASGEIIWYAEPSLRRYGSENWITVGGIQIDEVLGRSAEVTSQYTFSYSVGPNADPAAVQIVSHSKVITGKLMSFYDLFREHDFERVQDHLEEIRDTLVPEQFR